MDFTENCEIFSRSRCVNFNFHGVKHRNHSKTKNFHSSRETNHAVNDQGKPSRREMKGKILCREIILE